MSRPISLAELQHDGLSHAPFNAALLHTAVLAFPGERVSFHGFRDHIRAVREVLGEHAPEVIAAVHWRELPTSRGASMLARWRFLSREFNRLRAAGDRVLVCSLSRMMLFRFRGLVRPGDQVRAVMHGDLHQFEEASAERFPHTLFDLKRVLRRPLPAALRLIVLGQSIRDCIPAQLEPAFANACVIDHPYHFGVMQPAPDGPASFAVFGSAGDGEDFARIARSVKQRSPEISLSLIGSVGDEAAVARLAPFVQGVSTTRLSRDEFSRRARSVSHAIWLTKPGGYRLRASGTLFDALSLGKPLVYVANPYVDGYRKAEPAIGLRCENLDAVADAVIAVAASHNREQYKAAQNAILRLRERFTPEHQAAGLRACFLSEKSVHLAEESVQV